MTVAYISIEEAVQEYQAYVRRTADYSQKKMECFNIYFEILLKDCEKSGGIDLSKKADRESLIEIAENIVVLSKAECPDLKATKLERTEFFNDFVDFVSDSYAFSKKRVPLTHIQPAFGDLERKLDLVKNFRKSVKEKQETLAKRYYVSERTIRADLQEIKDGCLNAFGQSIDIDYDIDTKELFSTPVPIFLVQNITQIVAMLNGLGVLAKDERYRSYAEASATVIWKQLTLDVKERIINDLIELLHLDREWYELLEENAQEIKMQYYTERMISSSRNNVLMFLKNDMLCDVCYSKNNEVIHLCKVKLRECEGDGFKTTASDDKIEYCNLISIEESGN